MRKSANPAGPHDHSATIRQLKALVLILVISNIGLGVFAFWLLRATDRHYSLLVGRSVPVLNDFRELTADLADAMRASGTALLHASEAQRPEMLRRARATIERHRRFRASVLEDSLHPETPDLRAEMNRQGDLFDQLSEQVFALVAAGKIQQANELRDDSLRKVFDDYVNAIGQAAGAIEGASLKANTEMSAKVGSLSAVVLGLGGWPLIVLVALLVLTAVFVLILMVLFRGREMSDIP